MYMYPYKIDIDSKSNINNYHQQDIIIAKELQNYSHFVSELKNGKCVHGISHHEEEDYGEKFVEKLKNIYAEYERIPDWSSIEEILEIKCTKLIAVWNTISYYWPSSLIILNSLKKYKNIDQPCTLGKYLSETYGYGNIENQEDALYRLLKFPENEEAKKFILTHPITKIIYLITIPTNNGYNTNFKGSAEKKLNVSIKRVGDLFEMVNFDNSAEDNGYSYWIKIKNNILFYACVPERAGSVENEVHEFVKNYNN